MVRHLQNRRKSRFRCPKGVETSTCHKVLAGVWQLDWNQYPTSASVPPKPYIEHWENCITEANDEDLELNDHNVVIRLVDCLRSNVDSTWPQAKEQISRVYASQKQDGSKLSNEQGETALRFALQLWLHCSPSHKPEDKATIRQVLHSCLPELVVHQQADRQMSHDFSAKNLQKRGGIDVIWIDRLDQHLTILRNRSICVFRHSSMLRSHQATTSSPYPPDFVDETLQTLHLLFRPLEPKHAHRNVRYMEKHRDVDLELAMAQHAAFELAKYKFWGPRLAQIQVLYDSQTPHGLQQWFFDRRNRVQWATFWLAFLVLLLTVIFGLIQSITGVLQVVAAYRQSQ